jgi:diguanylate cyclase (GGDEF)-like protein
MKATAGKWLRGWSLWQIGRPAIGYLFTIEALALAGTIYGYNKNYHFDLISWVRAGLLLAMAVVYGEACDRIARLNRYLAADGLASNQNSVLCFAGVLVLPVQLAVTLVLVVYAHTHLRGRQRGQAHLYRTFFMAGSTMLATFAAAGSYQALGGQLGSVGPLDALVVLLSIAIYTVGNLVLLLVCLYLVSRPVDWRSLLPARRHVAYENSTLLFGAFSAVVVLHAPWLSPLILILIASLHRASLVTDLQHSANTDAKTGLLNSRGWQVMARQQLSQAESAGTPSAVLLIDLDHFKRVNDTHGHLAGDVVLKAVADILVRELRGYDAVGRYGGEEFIALLPGVDCQAALAIGERLRLRICTADPDELLTVTASVGIATGLPGGSLTLEDIIDAADIALYQAKTGGRDRVCLAPPLDGELTGQADQRRAFRNREPFAKLSPGTPLNALPDQPPAAPSVGSAEQHRDSADQGSFVA